MPDLANIVDLRLPPSLTEQAMFVTAMNQFLVFSLVLVRVSGLTVIGPLFGQSIVPANARVLLVIGIALVVTPALRDHWERGFDRLDANNNGRVSRSEVPDHLLPRFDAALHERGRDPRVGLAPGEFEFDARFPRTMIAFGRVAVGEFALGLVLGLGVFTVLSGLNLAGQLIDQQSGLALGEVVNPGLDTSGSITGQFLSQFGLTIFLVLEPFGGHLMIVTSLVETFQVIPAGDAFVSTSVIDYLGQLVHVSMILAIQVAAPVLAAMALVALTMGFLGHTVPQINVLVVGFPIRALVAVGVLALTFTGTARIVVDAIPAVLRDLTGHLTGVAG